ncbi:DEAD/DEAH box helicase [Paraburkholderia sp. J8-2]|uniref:DEAD/DEAH box helicase n=1 Tax=Paraburkholderia sp. J8-2 TaxID=2805440 RepID=UPI002AB7D7E0|nr:Helicase associated domain protein [Paraburkholderia sp. J8-2]
MGNRPPFTKALPPRLHQAECVSAVCTELEIADQTTAVMACGTGKTLVGSEVDARMHARFTIVFAPTLALIAQTIRTWQAQYPMRMANALCVCSDASVVPSKDGDDRNSGIDLDGLNIPVTTDPDVARPYFFNGRRRLVVFSTYQSSSVIADVMPKGFEFDLGIFDEAHRTTGLAEREFTLALDDAHIPVRKRLFMTATPRFVQRTTSSGPAVISMDDEAIYGRTAYRLGLREAIKRGLICDYRVVIACVDPRAGVHSHWLESTGPVFLDFSGSTDTPEVAALVAFQKAMAEVGATKAITFHRNVLASRKFAALSNAVKAEHKGAPIKAVHVNGSMTVGERDAAIAEFRDATDAIATNVRCLAEGVDMPEIEVVGLMSARRAPIELAQICGRTLRLNPMTGKSLGYIFVPIYLNAAAPDDIEAAVAGADFADVLDLLYAMASIDEDFAPLLSPSGRDVTSEGRALRELTEKIDIFAPSDIVARLRIAISARVAKGFGVGLSRESDWESNFREAQIHQATNGHLEVPRDYVTSTDFGLGEWLHLQARRIATGTLSKERSKRLIELGLPSVVLSAKWEGKFDAWRRWTISGSPRPTPTGILNWINNVRTAKRDDGLSAERERKLKEAGFDFRDRVSLVDNFIADYREFRENCDRLGLSKARFPLAHPDRGRFQTASKAIFNRWNEHTPDQINALVSLGLTPPIKAADKWRLRFDAYKDAVANNVNVNKFVFPKGHPAYIFTSRCRNERNTGALSADRIALLDSIGFPWTAEPRWMRRFQWFRDAVASNGKKNKFAFPKDHPASNFANACRYDKKSGTLSAERIALLDSIGFPWEIAKDWMFRFEAFKEAVASNEKRNKFAFPKDHPAATFANNSRYARKTGTLSADRIALLDSIGFPWEVNKRYDTREMIDRFLKHLRTSGTGWVGIDCPDGDLVNWSAEIRRLYKKGKLKKELHNLLDSAGFMFVKPKGA